MHPLQGLSMVSEITTAHRWLTQQSVAGCVNWASFTQERLKGVVGEKREVSVLRGYWESRILKHYQCAAVSKQSLINTVRTWAARVQPENHLPARNQVDQIQVHVLAFWSKIWQFMFICMKSLRWAHCLCCELAENHSLLCIAICLRQL